MTKLPSAASTGDATCSAEPKVERVADGHVLSLEVVRDIDVKVARILKRRELALNR